MSWADDFLRQQQGAANAVQAAGTDPDQSFVGGFVHSAVSAIPELFGEKPSEPTIAFRAQHPIAGIASQLVGGLVPYAGVGLASETVAGGKLLDEALQAIPGIK